MKSKKRLDSGLKGFHVATIPKAPRSIRKAQLKKPDEDICAFELLASLAKKLLQESESSSASSNASGNDHVTIVKDAVKDGHHYECKPLKIEYLDQGTSEVSAVVSESASQICNQKCSLNEFPLVEDDEILERTSKTMDSGFSGKNAGDLKSAIFNSISANENRPSKVELEGGYPNVGKSCYNGMHNKFEEGLETKGLESGDPTELCVTYAALVNSEKDVKLTSCRDPVPFASFSRQRNDVKLGVRDDDDNLVRNTKSSNMSKVYRPMSRIGDRRLRKLLTSRYWKVAPTLKDFELSRAANGVASSAGGHQASLHSKDSNVKFSIKSFRVPETFIEISETATVASLKRTVMDMVTAILGGGIRVGVLLNGKKIRDDNRTLSQSGISSEDNMDSLGFTLEPSSVLAPSPVCSEDPPLMLPSSTPQLVQRSPATPAVDSGIPNSLSDPSPITNLTNRVESNHEAMTSHTVLTDTTAPDSRALVPVPAMDVDALAVVPVNQKIRRSEIAQRRTRRPFSVAEVEALVQAVEELGTGRWRDVKLRSFEHADHRTYVDLKDKWKTLVHTASISPQQRRGEPVPQELLDRVLAAHAYWSQHQAKQQGKNQPGTLKLEAQADRIGVPGM
ncbi:Telomere repeat-binding protein 4 [Citrus sinensis]|uniref:Telomere repeat-binding protein 4 n=1 Tax=Citrus sinensis TaxID=2711 RepID=A0ACB8L0E9_CITSI|nr:Telomere repeat-binding protein 4 [Citrus sinensis]